MIDVGTIGNRRCEVVLNKILMEKNDEKLTHLVCSRILRFRRDLKSFEEIPDSRFRTQLFQLYLKDTNKKVEDYNLPKEVYSHLCCCLHAYISEYRAKTNKRL